MYTAILLLIILLNVQDGNDVYFLPSIDISNLINKSADESPLELRGLPINPSLVQIVNIGNRKVISLPILTNEPKLKSNFNSMLFDPKFWNNDDMAIQFGRPSLWNLPKNTKTVYCILLDPRSESDIGVGLVFIFESW